MTTLEQHPQSIELRNSASHLANTLRADIVNVRSTPTAKALLVGSVVMAAISCTANLSTIDSTELNTPETVQLAMHASTVATWVFATVAGVVSATADFRFGRIDQLLLSEPNRSIVFAAKALVATLVGFVYGVFGSIAAVAATAGFFAVQGETLDVLSGEVLRPLAGLLVGASLLGACGVAIGFLIRQQPAALAGTLVWLFIVEPTALVGLPEIGRWLPGAASLALTRAPNPNLLGQVPGGLLLLGWTAAALVISLAIFKPSDV